MPEFDADYKFLMDYLDKVQNAKDQNPDEYLEDDNSFYGTDSEDDEKEYQDLYGDAPEENNDQSDEESDPSEQENDSDQDDNTQDDENQYYSAMPPMGTANDFSGGTASEDEQIKKDIIKQESGGKYDALNPHSTAVGKYQFLWGKKPGKGWQDSIKKITGVKTKEEFRKSPEAQEKFYAWYAKKVLAPEAVKLQPYNKKNLTNSQLEKLIHFRGVGGAKKYLLGQLSDKPEKHNVSISSYIGSKQTGGAVAMNASAQHMGLNNPSFSELTFPMEGENTFRGLDDFTPVYVEDESGTSDVLIGPHHKKKFKGKVKEIKLQ